MILLTLHNRFKFSYLQLLYEASSRAKTPFFRVDSSAIQVIDDPLNFYIHLNTSANNSVHRIGLSSLYLGTGTLERHLLSTIKKRHKLCPDLMSAMAFDYHRSKRQENGEAPVEILQRFREEVGDKTQIGYVKVGKGKGVFGEILGVHHQKIYIFDDRVILGGANLSKNYFLNRRDRYLSIHSQQLSDYLYDYIQILSETSEKRLDTHYKLWKYANMPSQYCQNFHEQLAKIKNNEAQRQQEKIRTFSWQQKQQKGIITSRNQRISMYIGSSLTKYEPLPEQVFRKVRQQVREKLFTIKTEDYVGSQLQELCDPLSQAPVLAGKQVYLFPLIQWPRLAETQQSNLFEALLLAAAQQGHKIRLSSGYLNLNRAFFNKLSQHLKNGGVQLLCSAPTANSFYRGGGLKNYIPHMYRCYEENFLSDLGQKIILKEFNNNQWSFHAKGIWLEEAQNSFITSVGSSNFNERSKNRDSEFQLYIYSGCPLLNHRLNQQWQTLQKDCKRITLKQIKEDDDIRLSWPIRKFSRVLSSLL